MVLVNGVSSFQLYHKSALLYDSLKSFFINVLVLIK